MTVIWVLLLTSTISVSYACVGFEIKHFNVSPCSEDNVIFFDSNYAKLSENCEVFLSGCVEAKQTVNSGNLTYLIQVSPESGPPLLVEGDGDICSLLESTAKNTYSDVIFKMLNLPQQCPFGAGKICTKDESVSVDVFKNFLSEAKYFGHIEGKVDSGKFCVDVSFSMVKASATP